MLPWNPTTSHLSQISQQSTIHYPLWPPLDPSGDVCLVLEASGEAALNGLMPPSGVSNPNSLTPWSGNQENFCSDRGSPSYSEAQLGLRQEGAAPLTQQIPGGTTHREGGFPPLPSAPATGPESLDLRLQATHGLPAGAVPQPCSAKSIDTHSVRCL